jgi:predicted flap endonuclease-1-like 5' DNA nuclease
MAYPIDQVEGIGPAYAEKLKAAGIKTTEQYLDRAKDRKGRAKLAQETGIDDSRILRWANHCDLFRIPGVAGQMSELLEAAGVDTVKELARRSAPNLAKTMAEVNAVKKLTGVSPSEKLVVKWIEHAKTLAPMMTH